MLLDLIDGLSGDTAVESYEVHAVFRVKTYHIDKILRRQCGQVSLIVDDTVIDRNRTDHGRALAGELSSERLCISVGRQVHDRLRTHIYCRHDFLHLDIVVFTVFRYTEVDVDLRSQHRTDTIRIDALMVLITADRDFSFCDPLADLLLGTVLLLGNLFHLRGDDPLSCRIHLRRVLTHFFFLTFLFFAYKKLFYVSLQNDC